MFVDKFLLWKVFPLSCLGWILQVSVFMCPPNDGGNVTEVAATRLLDTLQHLLAVWSKPEFVQSSQLEQQACILSM